LIKYSDLALIIAYNKSILLFIMINLNLYKDAHLVISAIRVLEHRNSVPPSIDDVCNFISFSLEQGNYICRKLSETGIIEIVEGAFGIRLFVKNHLAIEEIPKDAKVNSMEEELKKFQDLHFFLQKNLSMV